MNDQATDKESNDRPSSSELLGTAASQIKRQGKPGNEDSEPLPPEETGRLYQTFIGLVSISLIILGIVAISALVWMLINTEDPEPAPSIVPPSLIYTETTREIQLATSTDITAKIEQFQEIIDLQAGRFSQFYFTQQTAGGLRLLGPREFFAEFNRDRSLPVLDYAGDTFMYGNHAIGTKKLGSYVILSITDYDGAYGQLLQSEEDLAAALVPLRFPAVENFKDTVIANQDVRFATSSAGGGIYWSFPQSDRLVITTHEATLRAVFNRLQQVRRSNQN